MRAGDGGDLRLPTPWSQEVSPDATRAAVDGEYGGLGLEVASHLWFEDGGGYRVASTPEELTDVEHELNGLLTYDRQVVKVDVERVRAVNRDVIGRRSTW